MIKTCVVLSVMIASNLLAYDDVALPPKISAEITAKQIQFEDVLSKECPENLCVSLGCQALKYIPLKKTPANSLPGFSQDMAAENTDAGDYLLTTMQCGFAYEPKLSKEQVDTIQKRVKTQMSQNKLDVQIRPQQLQPKVGNEPPPPVSEKEPPEKHTKLDELWNAILPFLPWIISIIIGAIVIGFSFNWIMRVLRKKETPIITAPITPPQPETPKHIQQAQVPIAPEIIFEKADRLRRELINNNDMCKQVIQPLIDEKRTDELHQLLRYFGPTIFSPVRDNSHNFETLESLSEGYAEFRASYDVTKGLAFLDWIESKMAGISVKVKTRPITESFTFLKDVSESEFVELLKDMSEEEKIAILIHAPPHAVNAFVTYLGVSRAQTLLENMVQYDALNEGFVRDVANRLRDSVENAGHQHRKIPLNQSQALERMIHFLPSSNRRNVVKGLIASAADHGHMIRESVFLEDALPFMGQSTLDELILEMDEHLLVHYFLSLNQTLRQQTLNQLSPKLKQVIELKISSYNQPVSDVFAASGHEQLAKLIKSRANKGLIDLGAVNLKMLESGE